MADKKAKDAKYAATAFYHLKRTLLWLWRGTTPTYWTNFIRHLPTLVHHKITKIERQQSNAEEPVFDSYGKAKKTAFAELAEVCESIRKFRRIGNAVMPAYVVELKTKIYREFATPNQPLHTTITTSSPTASSPITSDPPVLFTSSISPISPIAPTQPTPPLKLNKPL